MKFMRKALCLLLACVLLLGLAAAANADYFGENMAISWSKDLNGEELVIGVLLWDPLNLDNGDWTDAMFQEYKPYIELRSSTGAVLKTVQITSEWTQITVGKPGNYSLHVLDQYGNEAWEPEHNSYNGLTLTADDWKQQPPEDRDGAYKMGYVFFGRIETSGTKTTITLETMRESDSLAALVKRYDPVAEVCYYDEGYEIYISDGEPIKLDKPLTLDLAEHDGYTVLVTLNSDDFYADLGSSNSFTNYITIGKTPRDEPFDDVKEGDWYYETVLEAYYAGLVKGTGSGKFSPKATMTYAEAVTLAARIRALITDDAIPQADGPWYQRYVDYAKAVDIPCDYDMKAKITREDFAHIFYAVLPADWYDPINDIADGAIPDVGMDHPYAEEIYTLYQAGILTGDAQGSFKPKNTITRAEVATIVCRMIYGDFRETFTLR